MKLKYFYFIKCFDRNKVHTVPDLHPLCGFFFTEIKKTKKLLFHSTFL